MSNGKNKRELKRSDDGTFKFFGPFNDSNDMNY